MLHEIPPRSEVTTPLAVLPVPSTESDTREAETRAPRSSGSTLFLSEPQDESRAAIAAAVIAAANRTARLNVGERIVLEARVRHTYESHTLVSIATSPTRAAAHSQTPILSASNRIHHHLAWAGCSTRSTGLPLTSSSGR
jgi:hypothetical protein